MKSNYSSKLFCLMVLLLALLGASISAVAMEETASEVEAIVEIVECVPEAVEAEVVEEAPAPQVFVIRFVNWDGSEIMVKEFVEGEAVEAPAFVRPLRDGHEFAFWFDAESFEAVPFAFGKGADRDMALMAMFEKLPEVPQDEPAQETFLNEQGNDEGADEGNEPAFGGENAPEDGLAEDALLYVDLFGGQNDNENDGQSDSLGGEQEDEGLLTIEDEEIPLAGPAMLTGLENRSINIFSSLGDCIEENELVTLTGELIGFDGLNVSLQWQYNAGGGWQDAEGGDSLTYVFPATAESVNSLWRLSVTVNG